MVILCKIKVKTFVQKYEFQKILSYVTKMLHDVALRIFSKVLIRANI